MYKAKFIFFLLLVSGRVFSEGSMDSGGGHPVDSLFIKAQENAIKILDNINYQDIEKLPLEKGYKNWLRNNRQLSKFQFYSKKIVLQFQDKPCEDQEKPRGACFYKHNLNVPKVVVSRSLNAKSTLEDATRLFLHEAGHFTGEADHYFLDHLANALVTMNKNKDQYKKTKEKIEKDQWYKNRTKSAHFSSLAIGPFLSSSLSSDEVGYHLGYSYYMEVNPRNALKLMADLNSTINDEKVYLATLSFGLNHYFSQSDHSLYLGGDLGGGYSDSKNTSSNAGFSFGFSLGYMGFRTSANQLFLELRYNTLLKENDKGYPGIYGIQIGLLF